MLQYVLYYLLFIHIPWVIIVLPFLFYKYIISTIYKHRTFHEFFTEYYFWHFLAGPLIFVGSLIIFILNIINYRQIYYILKYKLNVFISNFIKKIELIQIKKEENKYKHRLAKIHTYYNRSSNKVFILDARFVTANSRTVYYLDQNGKFSWSTCSSNEIEVMENE